VAKAVLVNAVPSLMLRTATNPGGTPLEVFDGFRSALAAKRRKICQIGSIKAGHM
jgi:non-heme chloroperoxidase